jgi:protein-S-isoprenylcysteine O-methyltransferase Ste14
MRTSPRSIDLDQAIQNAPAAIALTVAGFAFLFGASSWPAHERVHESIETFGLVLIAVHAIGRGWCWRYAHPIDNTAFITTGPYSVCRNPQDLFLIIGGIGIGALFGSITSAFAGGLATWGIVCLRIIEEERRLRAGFGDEYQAYRRRVPKFIPDLSLWQAPDPARFRQASIFVGILRAWPLALAVLAEQIIEKLHVHGIVPVWFTLP